jgi:hypothetical protein
VGRRATILETQDLAVAREGTSTPSGLKPKCRLPGDHQVKTGPPKVVRSSNLPSKRQELDRRIEALDRGRSGRAPTSMAMERDR